MLELNLFLLYFFHVMGIIIGLGAVTVIDTFGFLARKSKSWTQKTIDAHHVTKPLIWTGTSLMIVSWIVLLFFIGWNDLVLIKTLIMPILVLNGCYLSFYVSPRLDKMSGKNKLVDAGLQRGITCSFLVSVVGWWSLVGISVWLFLV